MTGYRSVAIGIMVLLSGFLQGEPLATPALEVDLVSGSPVALTNRLTGEHLSGNPDERLPALEWHQTLLASAEGLDRKTSADTRQVSFSFRGVDESFSETVFQADPETGEMVVRQTGRSDRSGLSGIRWGMRGLPADTVRVIVPGRSGVAFGLDAPFSNLSFNWPTGWEAGMVLLQMARGGFLIRAVDPDLRFKCLDLRHRKGTFDLEFSTQGEAPFDTAREITSVEWRVTAYAGDWRVGAEIYRKQMAAQFALTLLAGQQPAWVREIRCVVTCGVDTEIIQELARHVVPERTLLYVPSWRAAGYDMNYPDYTALPGFDSFVAEAHRLGFRVMAHVNYFGCDPKNPLYETYAPFQLRSPHSKDLQWWTFPSRLKEGEEPRIKFAYIHPGCTPWRHLLISRWKTLAETYQIDALHLDQTLCIPNHAGGRVEGLTVPQANLLLHRELRETLPGVALSGEGLDEVTLPFEAFAQRHAAGAVNHTEKTWNNAFIQCGHPISSYLFLPYSTIYGYLGMSPPSQGAIFDAWIRAYENWGTVPTFSHLSLNDLTAPDARTAMNLELMGLWTRRLVQPDFSEPVDNGTLFRYRGENETEIVCRRLTGGGSECLLRDGEGMRMLYRYILGVTSFIGPGRIADACAFDESRVFGLDPGVCHLVLPGDRSLAVPRFLILPEKTFVSCWRRNTTSFFAELKSSDSDEVYRFAEHISDAVTGTCIQGKDGELCMGASFSPSSLSCGGVTRAGIFAHPPWQGKAGGYASGPGSCFGEFTVAIPAAARPVLAFSIGLRDGVNDRSDGVTFRISVNGVERFTKHWTQSAWDTNTLDLSAFSGQTVVLRFETKPGPEANATFDWACWGDISLRCLEDPHPAELRFSSPTPVRTIFPESAQTEIDREGDAWVCTVHTTVPGRVAFLGGEPTSIGLPAPLTGVPFEFSATVDGRSARLPVRYVTFTESDGSSEGEKRHGFAAHPPQKGRTYADFLLQLPATPAQLRFDAGIRDGSRTTGCRFLVEVNGVVQVDQLLNAPDGWHPGCVDLSAYAGRRVLITFVVDSEGEYGYDWAFWADPVIEAKP